MKLNIFSKNTWTLQFWESFFCESFVLVLFQIQLTAGLWIMAFSQTLYLSGISKPKEALNFFQPMVWLVFCGTGVTAVSIFVLFESILHTGIHENRVAYVTAWVMYVFIVWTGVIIQMLYSTPWMSVNIGLAALNGLILLPVFGNLRSIQKRKDQELTPKQNSDIVP